MAEIRSLYHLAMRPKRLYLESGWWTGRKSRSAVSAAASGANFLGRHSVPRPESDASGRAIGKGTEVSFACKLDRQRLLLYS